MSGLISQLGPTAKYNCLFLTIAIQIPLRTNPRCPGIDTGPRCPILLATHVLYPFPRSIIGSTLSPIAHVTFFAGRDGDLAGNDGGFEVDKVGGNLGAVVAGTDFGSEGLGGLGELSFQIADQPAIDVNYGVGFGEQRSAVEDVGRETMDCSGFSSTTSSNASYDTQAALSRSASTFAPHMPTDNFNFQPFDDSIFDDETSFLFKDELPGFDMDMDSTFNSGILPLPPQGFNPPGMELDMFDFQNSSAHATAAQSNHEGNASIILQPTSYLTPILVPRPLSNTSQESPTFVTKQRQTPQPTY
ncbi:hypothetical protein IFR05_011211 [Cadophora sp. M221]|nr:hypothetical protein IFR05_011211 [Cadophora sp. M221]